MKLLWDGPHLKRNSPGGAKRMGDMCSRWASGPDDSSARPSSSGSASATKYVVQAQTLSGIKRKSEEEEPEASDEQERPRSSDERFLWMAVKLAERSYQQLGRSGRRDLPFGAVIIDREGQVISSSTNCVINGTASTTLAASTTLVEGEGVCEPSPAYSDPTAHAEVEAIRQLTRRSGFHRSELAPCTMFASCEPCLMCTGRSPVTSRKTTAAGPGQQPEL